MNNSFRIKNISHPSNNNRNVAKRIICTKISNRDLKNVYIEIVCSLKVQLYNTPNFYDKMYRQNFLETYKKKTK